MWRGSGAVAADYAFFDQLTQSALHRGSADGRAKLQQLTFGKFPNSSGYCAAYDCNRILSATDNINSLFKVTICSQNDAKKILNERRRIFLIFMPSGLTLFKSSII